MIGGAVVAAAFLRGAWRALCGRPLVMHNAHGYLQRMIDGGGVVHVPAGEFMIDQSLFLRSNTHMVGASLSGSRKLSGAMIDATEAYDSSISDCMLMNAPTGIKTRGWGS